MSRKFLLIAVGLAVLIGVALIPLDRFVYQAEVGARAIAKVTCACTYIAGRDLATCRADEPPGFERLTTRLDPVGRSVEADLYGLVSARAWLDETAGCRTD